MDGFTHIKDQRLNWFSFSVFKAIPMHVAITCSFSWSLTVLAIGWRGWVKHPILHSSILSGTTEQGNVMVDGHLKPFTEFASGYQFISRTNIKSSHVLEDLSVSENRFNLPRNGPHDPCIYSSDQVISFIHSRLEAHAFTVCCKGSLSISATQLCQPLRIPFAQSTGSLLLFGRVEEPHGCSIMDVVLVECQIRRIRKSWYGYGQMAFTRNKRLFARSATWKAI